MTLAQAIVSAVLFTMGFACVMFIFIFHFRLRSSSGILMLTAATISASVLIWASFQAFPQTKQPPVPPCAGK